LIVVATKSDLQESQASDLVSLWEGTLKAREMGALQHYHCSSLRNFRVNDLLGHILEDVKDAEASKCVIA
jgi:hypothetical protein